MQKGEARRYCSDIEIQSSIGNCYNVLDMCFAYEMNSTCCKRDEDVEDERKQEQHEETSERFSLYTIY